MTVLSAIRWDGYYSQATGTVGEATRNSLSNPLHRHRAPFWATETSDTVLSWAPTQATMDAEIAFAAEAGIDWAFLLYNSGSGWLPGMNTGFDLFQSSADKNDIYWSAMSQFYFANGGTTYASYLFAPNTTHINKLVGFFQQANYRKVLTNRPLWYIWGERGGFSAYWNGSYVNLKTFIDAVRAATVAAGLGTPYIVCMGESPLISEDDRVGMGADAISSYVSTVPNNLNAPFSDLSDEVDDFAPYMASVTAGDVVPVMVSGWDGRPLYDRPPWFNSTFKPGIGRDKVVVAPTASEVAAQVTAIKAWMAANPSRCPADVMAAYSWNEHAEGGSTLCPTLGDPDGEILTAVSEAL